MAQNDLKWPKNDARIYALFLQFFLTEKAVPQTFLLLECMMPMSTIAQPIHLWSRSIANIIITKTQLVCTKYKHDQLQGSRIYNFSQIEDLFTKDSRKFHFGSWSGSHSPPCERENEGILDGQINRKMGTYYQRQQKGHALKKERNWNHTNVFSALLGGHGYISTGQMDT